MLTPEEWALTQQKRKKIVIKNKGFKDFYVPVSIDDELTSLRENSRAIRLFKASTNDENR